MREVSAKFVLSFVVTKFAVAFPLFFLVSLPNSVSLFLKFASYLLASTLPGRAPYEH